MSPFERAAFSTPPIAVDQPTEDARALFAALLRRLSELCARCVPASVRGVVGIEFGRQIAVFDLARRRPLPDGALALARAVLRVDGQAGLQITGDRAFALGVLDYASSSDNLVTSVLGLRCAR